MSISPNRGNDGEIDLNKSPADTVQTVETDQAEYAVYKLGEDVTGYSDFAKGENMAPGDDKNLLNFETNKQKYSLEPEFEGKALEVYETSGDYHLVIQRIGGSSLNEVPEEDREKIEQTLESLE